MKTFVSWEKRADTFSSSKRKTAKVSPVWTLDRFVARRLYGGDALYIAGKLDTADAASAARAQESLARGERLKLYTLKSWVVAEGEVKALLAPAASLERITGVIWTDRVQPLSSRWIPGRRACAEVAREIESVPVGLGLVMRPEQWPFSSAAAD